MQSTCPGGWESLDPGFSLSVGLNAQECSQVCIIYWYKCGYGASSAGTEETVQVSPHQTKSWSFSNTDGKHGMSYVGLHLKAISAFIIYWHLRDQKIVWKCEPALWVSRGILYSCGRCLHRCFLGWIFSWTTSQSQKGNKSLDFRGCFGWLIQVHE